MISSHLFQTQSQFNQLKVLTIHNMHCLNKQKSSTIKKKSSSDIYSLRAKIQNLEDSKLL